MTSKFHSLFFLLLVLASCSNEADTKPKLSVTQGITTDSISMVDIKYYPAFDNASVLHLDRRAGFGTFKVDTLTIWPYELPKQQFDFQLKDMEAEISIARFWDKPFLQSLQVKSKSVVRDGMHIWIFYTCGQYKDSVNVGNNYPTSVDSIIVEQLNYINDNTKDKAMRAYIKELKEYL